MLPVGVVPLVRDAVPDHTEPPRSRWPLRAHELTKETELHEVPHAARIAILHLASISADEVPDPHVRPSVTETENDSCDRAPAQHPRRAQPQAAVSSNMEGSGNTYGSDPWAEVGAGENRLRVRPGEGSFH